MDTVSVLSALTCTLSSHPSKLIWQIKNSIVIYVADMSESIGVRTVCLPKFGLVCQIAIDLMSSCLSLSDSPPILSWTLPHSVRVCHATLWSHPLCADSSETWTHTFPLRQRPQPAENNLIWGRAVPRPAAINTKRRMRSNEQWLYRVESTRLTNRWWLVRCEVH